MSHVAVDPARGEVIRKVRPRILHGVLVLLSQVILIEVEVTFLLVPSVSKLENTCDLRTCWGRLWNCQEAIEVLSVLFPVLLCAFREVLEEDRYVV